MNRTPHNARQMPLRAYHIHRACGCGDTIYAPIPSTPLRLEAAASKLTHEEGLACYMHGGEPQNENPAPRLDGPMPRRALGAAGVEPISAELAATILRWREKRQGAA